jgi:hypothetical protein
MPMMAFQVINVMNVKRINKTSFIKSNRNYESDKVVNLDFFSYGVICENTKEIIMKSNRIFCVILVAILLVTGFVSVETARALSAAKCVRPVSYSLQSVNMAGDILAIKVQDQVGNNSPTP